MTDYLQFARDWMVEAEGLGRCYTDEIEVAVGMATSYALIALVERLDKMTVMTGPKREDYAGP
jgi:hypothetical protein